MTADPRIYRLTSPSLPGGGIYFCYRDGQLSGFDLADARPTAPQIRWLLDRLPVAEAELDGMEWGAGRFELIPTKTAKEKLILFAQTFKSRRGVTYVATQLERSNIRTVPVTADLLRVFFDDPLTDFTIANYIKRINITKDRLKNGSDPTARMPNHYDPKYEAALTGDAITAYHRHLIGRGWRKAHGPAGTVWNPPPRTTE